MPPSENAQCADMHSSAARVACAPALYDVQGNDKNSRLDLQSMDSGRGAICMNQQPLLRHAIGRPPKPGGAETKLCASRMHDQGCDGPSCDPGFTSLPRWGRAELFKRQAPAWEPEFFVDLQKSCPLLYFRPCCACKGCKIALRTWVRCAAAPIHANREHDLWYSIPALIPSSLHRCWRPIHRHRDHRRTRCGRLCLRMCGRMLPSRPVLLQ
jgi:hypothetical protein